MKRRWGVILIALFALAGLANATYIFQNELRGTPLICTVGDPGGCDIVASSQYAYLFGTPVSEYGIFFFGILFVLAALELFIFDNLLRRVLRSVAGIGLLVSLYFVGVQFFVIEAACTYCLASAGITLLIFLATLFLL